MDIRRSFILSFKTTLFFVNHYAANGCVMPLLNILRNINTIFFWLALDGTTVLPKRLY